MAETESTSSHDDGGPGRGKPAQAPVPAAGPREIVVLGAKEHNLRGIDVRIPRDKLVVIT